MRKMADVLSPNPWFFSIVTLFLLFFPYDIAIFRSIDDSKNFLMRLLILVKQIF